MTRATLQITLLQITLLIALTGLVSCQDATRSVPQAQGQRANQQTAVSAPNEGQQYFHFDFGEDTPPPESFQKFAETITNKSGGSNTADASNQGDSSQEQGAEGDASGGTRQDQENTGELDLTVP